MFLKVLSLLPFFFGLCYMQSQPNCPLTNDVDAFLQNPEQFLDTTSTSVVGTDILDLSCLTWKMVKNFFQQPKAEARLSNLTQCLLSKDATEVEAKCYKGYLLLCHGITRHIPDEGTEVQCNFDSCKGKLRLLRRIMRLFSKQVSADTARSLANHIFFLRSGRSDLPCLEVPYTVDQARANPIF